MSYRFSKLRVLFSVLVLSALLAGCKPAPPVLELRLKFFSIVKTTPEGKVRMEMGFAAVGEVEEDCFFLRCMGTAG